MLKAQGTARELPTPYLSSGMLGPRLQDAEDTYSPLVVPSGKINFDQPRKGCVVAGRRFPAGCS